ncbi:uncharacterized protein LOC141600836 [Silene latifolia]|uniref:uncharacterized protein LOC141600836 n=1 Tax=Silene latifolia TaxID=37657 RepID=UPI003D7700C3
MGKSIESGHLANTLRILWKLDGKIDLIGLGKGFYSCKLERISALNAIKMNGPWFVHGHYLHVQDWAPDFRPSLATISSIPTWIVLPELPIEYHRIDVLRAIGDKLGGFIKFDNNGMKNKNSRFARISVYLDQTSPPPSKVWIGSLCQEVKIADKQIICSFCKSFCYGKCPDSSGPCIPDPRPVNQPEKCKMSPPVGVDQHATSKATPLTDPKNNNDNWTIIPYKNKALVSNVPQNKVIAPFPAIRSRRTATRATLHPPMADSPGATNLPTSGFSAGAELSHRPLSHLTSIGKGLSIEFNFQEAPSGQLLKWGSSDSYHLEIERVGHEGRMERLPHCGSTDHTCILPGKAERDVLGKVQIRRAADQTDLLDSFLIHCNMKIIFWNCRGIARPSFKPHITYLINAHKPDIFILSETVATNAIDIVQNLPFDSSDIVDPIGFSGGIMILWNARDVSVTTVNKGGQLINAVVQVTSTNITFFLTAIYASPKFRLQKLLWDSLIDLADNLSLPWTCLGDFNEVSSASEKFGGRSVILNRVNLFNDTMNMCNLLDLGFTGPKFTWTNHRRTNPILERLDRVWVNHAWLDTFPNSHNNHLIRLSSDHCPILLDTIINTPTSPPPAFKFESLWLREPSFHPFVFTTWCGLDETLPTKLGLLSTHLSTWASTTIGKLSKEKKSLINRLKGTQAQLCLHPNSSFLQNLNDSLSLSLNRVLDLECAYWKDRSRISWLNDGDRNTAFFHKSVTIRCVHNRILSLTDDVGITYNSPAELTKHITSFFLHLYTSQKDFCTRPAPVTSPTFRCCTKPSLEEIHTALFSLGSGKAPGPDGFHAGFFKNCWSTISSDLIPFILNIFDTLSIPSAINATTISLIPKVLSPSSIKQFRPISLCNTVYKVVTKIIVNRLKPIMPLLISPNQGSSIPGRGTDSHYIIASEIIHSMGASRCKKGWFALKLDLEKAFDRLE